MCIRLMSFAVRTLHAKALCSVATRIRSGPMAAKLANNHGNLKLASDCDGRARGGAANASPGRWHRIALGATLLVLATAPVLSQERITDLPRMPVTGVRIDRDDFLINYQFYHLADGGNGGFDHGFDGQLVPADGEPVDDKDSTNSCGKGAAPAGTPTTVGNPVVLGTGNKIESESDFSSSGEANLHLTRTYNHYWVGAGLFGVSICTYYWDVSDYHRRPSPPKRTRCGKDLSPRPSCANSAAVSKGGLLYMHRQRPAR